MKKITSLILLTALLFSLAGCQGQSEGESGVALRKGYYWGMPMEEVLTLAEKEGLVMKGEADEHFADFSDVPFGPITALEMSICVGNSVKGIQAEEYNGLWGVNYDFGPYSDKEAEQCVSKLHELGDYLTSVYGEPTGLPDAQHKYWKLDDASIRLTVITLGPSTFCNVAFQRLVNPSVEPDEGEVSP